MLHTLRAIALLVLLLALAPLGAKDPDVIQVGIVESLIKDLSPGKRKVIDSDFPDLVKDFTGFKSKADLGGDADTAVKNLEAGKWQLAVLQGVEFAWVQSKDPNLQPLMLAIDRQKALYALLVTGKDNSVQGFKDLQGKKVALLDAKEHCRLFAEKNAGGDPAKFFGKLEAVSSGESALDDILLKKVDADVVDNVALDSYKDINPGRFARLKVVAKSEQFPATVIVYRKGGLSEEALAKFRDGMLKANSTEKGRDAMANFRVTAFEPVPPDYPQELASVRKAYPPPGK